MKGIISLRDRDQNFAFNESSVFCQLQPGAPALWAMGSQKIKIIGVGAECDSTAEHILLDSLYWSLMFKRSLQNFSIFTVPQ